MCLAREGVAKVLDDAHWAAKVGWGLCLLRVLGHIILRNARIYDTSISYLYRTASEAQGQRLR
jgi:hypothetical protein